MVRVTAVRRLACLAVLAALAGRGLMTGTALAQAPERFTVGGRDIFRLDLAGVPLGSFPTSLEMVDGVMDVVSFAGRPMLRASSRSTFLIRLPEVLAENFTIECELVPKATGNPEDIAIEGTQAINQGPNSANVMWHRDYLQIVGGGPTYDSKVPPSLAGTLPGRLTQVVLAVQGQSVRLFTNGRLMYAQANRKFVRGRVLRIFLGGQDDGQLAVHLAALRVVEGVAVGPLQVASAGGETPSRPDNPQQPVEGKPPETPPNKADPGGATGVPGATIVTDVTVTLGPDGPVVDWQHAAAPAIYTVQRWKTDDPQCCNNTSAADPPLTGPPWQDQPPPLSGTYTYRVTAVSSSGSATAGTSFDYVARGRSGQPPAGGQSTGPRAVTPAAAFSVTVAMGPSGPVVAWTAAPGATGYRASRTKVDDANCCNTSFGARTYGATSPWQDQPLPMPGTYLYQVVAVTPGGQVLAETTFEYREPLPTGGPRRPVPAPNAPASPRFVVVEPTPTTAKFSFDVVAGAAGYRIRREVAASGQWTDLTPTPIPQPEGGATAVAPFLVDGPLDHRLTYRYELHALQADGTYGTTPHTHTPPAPADPSGFTATMTGPGQVRLDWQQVAGATSYRLNGPGTSGGISVVSSAAPGSTGPASHTLTGLPAGTHRWTIATDYQPGGVLTSSGGWPSATATISAADPAPRYRLIALGVRAVRQSVDADDARDGIGDEIYLTALVNQTRLTGLPLPVVKEANVTFRMTRSHGSEAVAVPYGRIKAGTASAVGGIRTGDRVPASLDLPGPTPGTLHDNQFPLLLWEGSLEADAVVVVHTALWEDDVNPRVQANWMRLQSDEARTSYSPQADYRWPEGFALDKRTYRTYESIARLADYRFWPFVFDGSRASQLFQCNTTLGVIVRRPCEVHGVDRPFGLKSDAGIGLFDRAAGWSDRPVVLTRTGVERLLVGKPPEDLKMEALGPGTFFVNFTDDDRAWDGTEAIASYYLYLRLERVP